MSHKGLVRKHVKGHYGEWYLVLLMSGKWAVVWWCFLNMEDEFLAIVSEDLNWFDHQITFAMPNVFATKTEALENIVAACAEGLSDHPANDDFFVLSLEKAKRALRKATREAPDVKNMTTEYQRELAALAASKREENPR